MHIKRIQAALIAGLLLLMLVLPQLALAAGPEISNVVVLDYTSTTATIFWTTNTTGDSVVRYGTTTPPSQVESDSSDVTTHFIYLTGLTPNTKYYFEVKSTDVSGTSTDNNGGAYYSFTTLPITGYSITLDPVCGVCGELVDVELCNEVIEATVTVAAAGTYHVCWDSRTAANVKGTFSTTMAGSRTLVFYMPEAKEGIHNVYLTTDTYAELAKTTFEVFPFVTIDPEEGPVGTEVTVNGYGFAASRDIRVSFQDTVKTDKADTVGSWEVLHTIPATPAPTLEPPPPTPIPEPVTPDSPFGYGIVLYSRADYDEDTIWYLNSTGDNQFMVGSHPRLSPNGLFIVYQRGGWVYGDLYVRDLLSGVDTRVFTDTLVFTNDNEIHFYDWTTDSTQIIFDYACSIYIMGVDGSNPRELIGNWPDDGTDTRCWNDGPATNPSSR